MKLEIQVDYKAFERMRRALSCAQKEAPKAISRAINRALTAGNAAASKNVREHFALQASTVKNSLRIKKAKPSDLSGELISKGKRLSLFRFKVKPTSDTTGARRRPIRATVEKSGGEREMTDAFVWRQRVIRRMGKRLETARGPSVPETLQESSVMDGVESRMQEVFEARLEHELKFMTQGKK